MVEGLQEEPWLVLSLHFVGRYTVQMEGFRDAAA